VPTGGVEVEGHFQTGACSCLKYNFVEVANLYYFKVEEKRGDDLMKISSES
jgi:hypothetical protein